MQDNKEERFPIVDEQGQVVGSATRGECHNGSRLLHPVVHLHVFNSRGELYLQKRPEWKDIQPGKWDTSVGGHMDYGETPEQALTREVREELGIVDFVPERVGQYVFDSRRERELVYVNRTVYDGPVRPSADELDGGRFWTIDEIRAAIGNNILTPNFESEFQRFFLTNNHHKKVRTIEMQRLTVEEFREAEKLPLVVVLDDVRSMHNVGSVLRTADTFRVEAVYLCGITSTPPSAEIHKTALGAEDSVEWHYYPTAQEAVNHLHEEGYTVFSVEQVEHSTKLQRFQAEAGQRYAVVLGNEVKGVHQEVVDLSDGCLEIPQLGTKHSMNVSVTAGIVIYKFAEQLLLK